MKGLLIAIILLALFVFGMAELAMWYNNLPDVKATIAKADDNYNWYSDTLDKARNTNDTKVLKSIYLEAINRGANPSDINDWDCCTNVDYIYKYSHAKYEALIQK